MDSPAVALPDGDRMPVVGFGTGGLHGDELGDAVSTALEAGYTRFDTAEGYGNENALGDALADADRSELFLTSKVLPSNLDYESLIGACEASLDRLGTDYLDLYLIHWPNPAVSLRESLDAMATLRDRGLVRNVGVSNFSAYQLSCAQHVSDVPIAVNQIEFHPWHQQPDVVEYCEESGVVVDAAAPLARTQVFDDDMIRELAATYDRSPGQIVLKWALERGATVIPQSTDPGHVRENATLFDWELSADDCRRIDERDRSRSVYNLAPTDWSNETFGIAR
ncbi:aldo/keto reductase [Halosimplex salinum]|uniref:aldo/keto reductase n=1 Tax=Halosimplex salinum TaxID=1710538 RepID=UPI000F4996C4|nr:aldo/keto reductase [Halosimplex salinum]